jgi:oligopeptide/dipeptide ABC transporter ATP-binding protein
MHRFIDIIDLTKAYEGRGMFGDANRRVLAVDRVSFGIDRNSVFGLVGESGCGKTTLVRSILYLDPPTAGQVWMDGIRLGDLPTRDLRSFRKRMQIVFQDPNSALDPKMRVEDSLAEGLINRGIPASERDGRIHKLLDLVGIPAAHRKRYPHEFSGGQKQRIVVARALAMEPDFLALDEPVSNLDVSIQAQIINLLVDLKTELSLTYLFISHDLNLVGYLSDIIAVMYRGRVVELAPADELLAHPHHPYTRMLFASIPGRSWTGGRGGPDVVEEDRSGITGGAAWPCGCPFAEHCSEVDSTCSSQAPELVEVSPGHRVACSRG